VAHDAATRLADNGSVSVKVYQYPKCSTCRKALKWLDAKGVAYTAINIVDKPPSKSTLRRAQKLADVPLRKLFNTSGQSYRQGGFKDKLGTMSEAESFAALADDGKLIKRPLLVGDGVALVGFKEADWAAALLG
jgi:arsenate reductase